MLTTRATGRQLQYREVCFSVYGGSRMQDSASISLHADGRSMTVSV